jgi:hypothetical protein
MQDPRSVLQTMILERNKCAHESSYTVSNLSVRPVPGQVIQFALAADIAMSVAAERMRLADVNFYQTISGSHTAGSDFASCRSVETNGHILLKALGELPA